MKTKNNIRWAQALSLLLSIPLTVTTACSNTAATKIILSDLQPLPAAAANLERPVVIAVAGTGLTQAFIESYQQLADYLGKYTGKTFELTLCPTYEEVNDLVRTGVAGVAFVNSGAYVEGQQQFGMQALVAPEISGSTVQYSYIIVPAGSPSQSLTDLEDTTFACTSPLSDTGRLAPAYALVQKGTSLETFFHRASYTYSDEKSIKAVAEFLYDGAAVNSLTYESMLAENPAIAAKTRIVEKFGPYQVSPVVVPPFIDVKLKNTVRDALLNADKDEQGHLALKSLGIDRFVMVQDGAYDGTREMAKKVWWTR